ncbi:carbonic anhydrase 12 [Chanos chanos]|uniref:Carbonic anhydrase n=1 Tax=Chanos chanos TaxID=29144 RepID=A0A6J2UQ21_CHACN|nr:carbonic anhydrase 12 [Chanos chanos]
MGNSGPQGRGRERLGVKWTYSGPEGEHHWSKHYPFCGGAFQSPIDIQRDFLQYDPNLLPIEIQNYNLSSSEQLTLGNNGHSVQLSLPSSMYISSLPQRYSAAQLHFHWGSSTLPSGSEHTINGKQYPAEMHVVHFNSDKYPNISMAMDKSDGLAVLGVLMELGEFNPAFDQFLKYINGIKYRDQKLQVPAFNIRELLPSRLDEYYRYDGSLTTPPCYPSVLWTVFRRPITISPKQFQTLASTVYSSHAQESASVPLAGNYRKPQQMDNRVVLVSFQEGRGLHGTLTESCPVQRRKVIHQLLLGDLADLADERLHQPLPMDTYKASAANQQANKKSHRSWSQATQKQQQQKKHNPSIWKNPQISRYVRKSSLSFVSLEENVSYHLKRFNAEDKLIQTLRDVASLELNLKSYLDCKSHLSPQTVRQLLHGRPSDEATELYQSLTKATLGQRKRPVIQPQGLKLNNAQSTVHNSHRFQHAERED